MSTAVKHSYTCYNYADFVAEAIDSVLSQNAEFVEIIVVDDGSTDRSWEIISLYGNLIKALRIKNGGAVNACLYGYAQSRGDYIYFLDADDYMKVDSLSEIYKYLVLSPAKIQFSLTPVDENAVVLGPNFPALDINKSSWDFQREIVRRGSYQTPPTSGNIYRRDVYSNLGDLSYDRGIDGVAYLLAPFLGEVISVPKALACYRVHKNNLSSFSNLSADRMDWYRIRFENRLEHLKRLIENKNITLGFSRNSRRFSYVIEFEIMGLILRSQSVSLWKIVEFSQAIIYEEQPVAKHVFALFYLMTSLMPRNIANQMLIFRIDQSKFPRIRKKLKGLLHPRRGKR